MNFRQDLKPLTAAEPRRVNRYLEEQPESANKLTDLSFEHKLIGVAGSLPNVENLGKVSTTPTPKLIGALSQPALQQAVTLPKQSMIP